MDADIRPTCTGTSVKTSWAEQVELGDEGAIFPPNLTSSEFFDEELGFKKVIAYKVNDDKKRVKVIKTYKIETQVVSTKIAKRKELLKFGKAKGDPPGPNIADTIICEEITMTVSKDFNETEEDPLARLKGKIVTCRICKGDHWTTKCPYKDSLAPLQETLDPKKDEAPSDGSASTTTAPPLSRSAKYIPPSMREGGNKRGESMNSRSRGDDQATIRVSNLSEDTRESDLQDLFSPFGKILRIFLAKDKVTGQSKGFAYINFSRREEAAKAIEGVSGYGYDHLILSVEWAKPSQT